jgi:hypothetical protein
MASHLGNLPGGELGVDFPGLRLALLLEAADFIGDVERRIVLRQAQFFDLAFEVGDRLFKVEERCFSSIAGALPRAASAPR